MQIIRNLAALLCASLVCGAAIAQQTKPYPAAGRQTSKAAVDPGGKNWSGMWERADNTPRGIPWDTQPPLRPEIAEKFRQGQALTAAGKPPFDPTVACLPPGMPRMMAMVQPMEIVQRVGEILVFAEWDRQVRRIYTDGRKYAEEKDQTYNGYSVGHWENGDLLTEVRGFKDKVVFNAQGIIFTDALVMHERWHEESPDLLRYTMTVEDPKVLTGPWVASKLFRRAPTLELGEYVCLENNRNSMTPDGSQGVILPNAQGIIVPQ